MSQDSIGVVTTGRGKLQEWKTTQKQNLSRKSRGTRTVVKWARSRDKIFSPSGRGRAFFLTSLFIELIDPGGEGFEWSHHIFWRWTGKMPVSRIASTASGESKIPFTSLLLEHAGVSGNAQPFALRIDPGVGEPPVMIEYESFSSLLRLHGPFEQLRLRGELRFGIIFGSDKNVEILIGDGVLEFTFEFVVHLQHASILGVLPPSLNPYHVGLPRRS